MIRAYTAAAVRAAEAPLLDAGRGPELMRLAAYGLFTGVARLLRSHGRGLYGASAVLLVGAGNNGGDTLFAGARLAARGTRTTALLAGARSHPDALAAFRAAGGRCIDASDSAALEGLLAEAASCDVIIDGLLGTGGRGGLREPSAGVVRFLQTLPGGTRPLVVACDLPSGVDAGTGEVCEPVLAADLTLTFGAHKAGLMCAPAEELCGRVALVDIGLQVLPEPEILRLEAADAAVLLPLPRGADHKYTRGVAGIVAGSARYPGAALLAAAAASACGPGMVRALVPDQAAAALHVRNPEVVCSPESPEQAHVQAWLVGPGIDGDGVQLVRARLAMTAPAGVPVVVDAAALPLVKPAVDHENSHMILTPHAGELAAMFAAHSSTPATEPDRAAIEAAPLAAARRAAALFGATVLLKGSTTVIATPGGTVYSQHDGTPRLAAAGSGDTLAGILTALLAMGAGLEPGEREPGWTPPKLARAAALAALLHGRLSAGPLAQPLNAGQLAQRIPAVWAELAATPVAPAPAPCPQWPLSWHPERSEEQHGTLARQ